MSLRTWKKEFYPKAPTKRMTELQAIEHSLQKWKGLRKANLKKHGVFQDGANVWENGAFDDWITANRDTFVFDSKSCALCVKHFLNPKESSCEKCPLAALHGGTTCMDMDSVYENSVENENPSSMIESLMKLQKLYSKTKRKTAASVKTKTPKRPSASKSV